MTILSERPDGAGYYYSKGRTPQINVREERPLHPKLDRLLSKKEWVAYVGANRVGVFGAKDEAEAAAIAWAQENPETP